MQALNPYGPGRLTEYDTGNTIYSGAQLWTFGGNGSGELGINSLIARSSPVQVGALTTWSQVACGNNGHTAAIKTDATLWTWGSNGRGQLGTGNKTSYSSPVQVGSGFSTVSQGSDITVGLKTNGAIVACGGNDEGQLGQGDRNWRSSLTQIGALTTWLQIDVSNINVAAIRNDNTLWVWGRNYNGQLGLNNRSDRSSPVQVGTLTNWAQVGAGFNFTLAVKTDGTLWSWGRNIAGALGHNDRVYRSSPVQIGALTNWFQATSGYVGVALKTDDTLWAQGQNGQGAVGDGASFTTDRSSPVQVGSASWRQVSAKGERVSAISLDDKLWVWGSDNEGQLGLGTRNVNRSEPAQVGSSTNWVSVGTGRNHTGAILGVV
jgi:alpha-tubulin suppressor-like RCC1 family protein